MDFLMPENIDEASLLAKQIYKADKITADEKVKEKFNLQETITKIENVQNWKVSQIVA